LRIDFATPGSVRDLATTRALRGVIFGRYISHSY
jgi:hypothetical protein